MQVDVKTDTAEGSSVIVIIKEGVVGADAADRRHDV